MGTPSTHIRGCESGQWLSPVRARVPGGEGEQARRKHRIRQVSLRRPAYSPRSLAAGDKREGSLARGRRLGWGSALIPAV